MADTVKWLLDGYDYAINDLADKRLEHLPLIKSPIPVIGIVVVYLMFIFKWGPEYMRNRQPYDLRKVLLCYNAVQCIGCFIGSILGTPHVKWSLWYCNPLQPPHLDHHMIRDLGYLYYISKYIDLLDTVFFVLRKNYRQITVLHVSHHTVMVLGVWAGIKYLPSGHSAFVPYINAIVHSVMYGYYFLSAYDPKYRQGIWWKKHITQLQLCQFGLAFILYGAPIIYGCDTYPRGVLIAVVIFNAFLFSMFAHFYYHAYIKKPTTTEKKS